jgi:glycosyltransferase involved in cell wall biosynthesis
LPPGDPDALAVALLELLRDPAAHARMAARARAFIAQEFDIERNTRALRELFGPAARTAAQAAHEPATLEE